MPRLNLVLLCQLFIFQSFGQSDISFHPPVKIPMYLSGNFGEIRSDHLHSGIDIKTQGTIGQHVFSIEDGYVSRIKVQANGYGKSIYITHPNGFTSVYGHLDRYRDDIADYVKQMQYTRRSHMVDLYLKPDQIKLKKGDFIAYSGNTGSSSGPHLHFEIRSTGNQHPTNVLNYNFDIKDHVAPRFLSLFVYPMDKESHVNGTFESRSFRILKDNGIYTIPYGSKMNASGRLGISVEVFDYLNGASNQCGVYTLEMYVDEKLTYKHIMEEFSFSETRYVNAHIDYGERIRSGARAHRLHRLPNDRLRIYNSLENDGVLEIQENKNYEIRVVATDVAGNSSELKFTLLGDLGILPSKSLIPHYVKTMKFNESNRFDQEKVKMEVPVNALYQDLDFTFEKTPGIKQSLTDFYHISTPEIPVHLPYTLSIEAPLTESALRDKLLMITINEDQEIEAAGGEYIEGAVVASLRSFGKYAISLDTIAPEIIPLNGSGSTDLTGKKRLRFIIRDHLSGIEKYEGYIDNEWVLFEYDLKNDLLNYTFDSERITIGSDHELELYVRDAKGNVNLFHTSFTW
jgi:murein DD-endopeptidase MepM/ murein hydrolase activator NlpD